MSAADPSPVRAQSERLTGGGFEDAPSEFSATTGTHIVGQWRWFAVAGAEGSMEVVSAARSGTRAIRLTRLNTAGDTALDRDTPELRIPVHPGGRYLATVWARSTAGSRLLLRLALYNAEGNFLGVENQTVHQLSSQWTPFTTVMTAGSSAASCNFALRLDGAGEMVVDDLSLVRLANDPPAVVLPTGVSTDLRPRIEWRGAASSAYEIAVTDQESPTSGVIWNSGQIVSSANSATAPLLPSGRTLYTFVRVQTADGWTNWSERLAPFRIEPLPTPEGSLHTLDLDYTRALTPAEAFQHAHLAAAVQGIVNRDEPHVFVQFVNGYGRNVDAHWLSRLRQPDRWLSRKTVVPAADLVSLVTTFRSHFNGVVIWDPQVEATSNLASTVAGADNLLPLVRDLTPGSLYMQLVNGPAALPVVIDLEGRFTGSGMIADTSRPSTGSRKCDAYIWAIEKYLKPGRVNPAYMGYYIDAYWIRNPAPGGDWQNHTLTNHDYFIARKAFFWDLHVWGDEAPIDDPAQPLGTDVNTLKEILAEANVRLGGEKMIHVGGFTPWAFKYTDFPGAGGSYGGVHTEWETVRLLSAYNAYVDADALHLSALANASLYSHMPLPARYTQPLPPMPGELKDRGLLDAEGNVVPKSYLLHYVGDYDSAAWLNTGMPQHWDVGRGATVIPWAVNPNLSDRAPHVFEYQYRTRTGLDHFMAGDSGAGYVNPTQLFPPRSPSGLASGEALWQRHCRPCYGRFGLSFTGFLINGLAGPVSAAAEAMYRPFSVNGIVNPDVGNHGGLLHLEDTMPAFVMTSDLSGNLTNDRNLIGSRVQAGTRQFLVFRSILQGAGYYVALNSAVQTARPEAAYVFCDPMMFSFLGRKAAGGENRNLSSTLFDTFPAQSQAGQEHQVELAVRNDGWNSWPATAGGGYKLLVEASHDGEFHTPALLELPRAVAPGDAVVLSLTWVAPSQPGDYQIRYEPADSAGLPFSSGGNAPALKTVKVTGAPSGVEDFMRY